jgi:hypothetical protein
MWQFRSLFLCFWCLALVGFSSAQNDSAASSKGSGAFTLSGTVVNSVTGEPIGRALVRVSGVVQRTAFTDGEGRFQIEGLPAGSVDVGAKKPGYFSQQELNNSRRNSVVAVGPESGPVLLKLTPRSAIYGRITEATGQPIEQMPVRLTERNVRDGRLHWDSRGFAQSDEDGRFRFANLMPGTYYLAVGPGRDNVRVLANNKRPKAGYPSVYYPGVPDLASTSPIQLAAGQQTEADFSMTAVPVYHVSGTVTGYPPDQGVALQLLNQSGEVLSFPVRFNLETGVFDLETVPAGSYVLKASSPAGDHPLRAEIRLNVAANVDNVHLVLGPTLSIPVVVRMESSSPSNLNTRGWNQQRPPVSVRLIPTEPLAREQPSTYVRQSQGNEVMTVQDVEPGRYYAEVMAWGPWYVQSAVYGETNLLSEDLTVAPGQTYPIEIVLRDDGATLTGKFKSSDGAEAVAPVLVVPQPASKRGIKVTQISSENGFSMNGLAPGDYLVFAFDHADKIEYASSEMLQPYASQATHVTLSPNHETQVMLNLIRTGDGE